MTPFRYELTLRIYIPENLTWHNLDPPMYNCPQ